MFKTLCSHDIFKIKDIIGEALSYNFKTDNVFNFCAHDIYTSENIIIDLFFYIQKSL